MCRPHVPLCATLITAFSLIRLLTEELVSFTCDGKNVKDVFDDKTLNKNEAKEKDRTGKATVILVPRHLST